MLITLSKQQIKKKKPAQFTAAFCPFMISVVPLHSQIADSVLQTATNTTHFQKLFHP